MESKKLIFGLSPAATIINGIILTILSSLSWTLKFTSDLQPGLTVESALQSKDNVPWYYDMILIFMAMLLIFKWVEYKFDLKPGEFTWKSIQYKYIYVILGMILIESISKAIFLLIIL